MAEVMNFEKKCWLPNCEKNTAHFKTMILFALLVYDADILGM